MIFTPQVYPLSFSANLQRNELEYSNQVILPPEILAHQKNYEGDVLFFELRNMEKKMNVGVYEFTDIPDVCYIPYYFMRSLGIKEGDRIQVELLSFHPPPATSIVLKPQEHAFLELYDPKLLLENYMSQYYPIVSLNDVIRIRDKDIDYCLLVTKLEPSDVVQTINCDISLEFEDAIDFVPRALPSAPPISPMAATIKSSVPPIPPPTMNSSPASSSINQVNKVGGGGTLPYSNYKMSSPVPHPSYKTNTFIPFQGKGRRLGDK